MVDLLIVGGGVIGLSLAYESAGAGLAVRVIDQGEPGCEASWAGAGILPPAPARNFAHPYEQLAQLCYELHPEWSARLREETGIDNGYRRCGGLYLARDRAAQDALAEAMREWLGQGIVAEELTAARLAEWEPCLSAAATAGGIRLACGRADEGQLRNPWHLKALLAACARRGVEVSAGVAAEDFSVDGRRIQTVLTSAGPLVAGNVCFASGAWTRRLLARLGLEPALRPVRGQMVLLAGRRPILKGVVNEGPRYLVPRTDGRILVGSTEEDVGFDKRPTAGGVAGLLDFALSLVPALGSLPIERYWAGLRPATNDGFPYLGALPGLDNAYVAAGHFRNGIQLSPGTAVVMARLIRGEKPGIDLSPFRVDRA